MESGVWAIGWVVINWRIWGREAGWHLATLEYGAMEVCVFNIILYDVTTECIFNQFKAAARLCYMSLNKSGAGDEASRAMSSWAFCIPNVIQPFEYPHNGAENNTMLFGMIVADTSLSTDISVLHLIKLPLVE